MSKPLFICDAAMRSRVNRQTIRLAMLRGHLDWKFYGNRQATTKEWVDAWKRS